jgi:hypothetical protein
MERDELKQIMDYLKELEGEVEKEYSEQHYRGLFCLQDLNMLYSIIKYLMDSTYMTDDRQLKQLLVVMEYRARKCKDHIEEALAVKN